MIEWSVFSEFISTTAGFLTSLSVIVGVVYKWVWKPHTDKKEKREKQWQKEMLEISKKQVMPISKQLELLEKQSKRHDEMDVKLQRIAEQNVAIIKEMREEFKEHNLHANERDKLIAQNAEIIKNHEKRLDTHNERLLILETVSG